MCKQRHAAVDVQGVIMFGVWSRLRTGQLAECDVLYKTLNTAPRFVPRLCKLRHRRLTLPYCTRMSTVLCIQTGRCTYVLYHTHGLQPFHIHDSGY